MEQQSSVAKAIEIVGYVIIGLGIAVGVITLFSSVILAIACIFSCVISGLLFLGLAEIINLLKKLVDQNQETPKELNQHIPPL